MSEHGHEPVSLTRNQSLVMTALETAAGPLSAYALLEKLRDDGLRAPLQVYRALDKLVEIGLVHRLESLNAFVACSHPGCETHATTAFMICNTCGHVGELTDADLAVRLATLAGQTGFAVEKSTVELRGHCGSCQPSSPSSPTA